MAQRIIKFRAWDGIKMIQNYAHVGKNGRIIVAWEGHDTELVPTEFTGLLDKNGKEIYEGDVVNVGEDRTYIEFENGAYWFCFNKTDRFTYDWLRQQNKELEVKKDTLEIIGNIYESPALLSQ